MKTFIFFSLLVVTAIIGCGKAEDTSPGSTGAPSVGVNNPGLAYPGYQCQPGQYGMLGGCTSAPSWDQACYMKGGTLITSGGRQLCKILYQIATNATIVQTGGIPKLTPSQPTSGTSVTQVRQGEQVIFTGSTKWEKLSTFYFNPCTGGSSVVDQDGVKNGQVQSNEGLPQGFMGSDGTNVFLLGSSAKITFQSDGVFRWGFNTTVSGNTCFKIQATSFYLSHCSDSSGSIFACP